MQSVDPKAKILYLRSLPLWAKVLFALLTSSRLLLHILTKVSALKMCLYSLPKIGNALGLFVGYAIIDKLDLLVVYVGTPGTGR